MQQRPLMLQVGDEGLTQTYLVLEKLCAVCSGTGLKYPELTASSPPCDHCANGYTTTAAGEVILRLVAAHLMPPTQYGGILKPVVLRNLFKVTQGE